jgi:hypothetical protein
MAETRTEPRVDPELAAALVKQTVGYRDRAPVLQVEAVEPQRAVKAALSVAPRIWPWLDECRFRVNPTQSAGTLALMAPGNGRVNVYLPSGAVEARLASPTGTKPIASDEQTAKRELIRARAQETAEILSKSHVGAEDEMRFERLWETKARGVTLKGETATPTALFGVTAVFRRWLHGLPVLGRPSIQVAVGSENTVRQWAVDWRRVRSTPVANSSVIDPQAGAMRLLEDIAWRRPEKPFTLDDFAPVRFALCYATQGRRSEQRVFQPVWLAILEPRGFTSMGIVTIVPAAPQAFEPIGRPMRATAAAALPVPH